MRDPISRLVYIMPWLAAGLLVASPVRAQDAPRPGALVEAWVASQAVLGADLERVALRERSEWTLDGPFGVRRIRLAASVEGVVGAEGWDREVTAVEVNGRRVPPRRWNEIDIQRRNMVGPAPETAARAIIHLHQLVRGMASAGQAAPEVLDGAATWRVELVPRERNEALQRYTLWFDRALGHLVRSRAVIQGRRRDVPFVVTTDYMRIDGFDVPRARHIEGTAQMKRRLRTYTLLFEYRAGYSDYRFFRRP